MVRASIFEKIMYMCLCTYFTCHGDVTEMSLYINQIPRLFSSLSICQTTHGTHNMDRYPSLHTLPWIIKKQVLLWLLLLLLLIWFLFSISLSMCLSVSVYSCVYFVSVPVCLLQTTFTYHYPVLYPKFSPQSSEEVTSHTTTTGLGHSGSNRGHLTW
jgi:hypothetical protein